MGSGEGGIGNGRVRGGRGLVVKGVGGKGGRERGANDGFVIAAFVRHGYDCGIDDDGEVGECVVGGGDLGDGRCVDCGKQEKEVGGQHR